MSRETGPDVYVCMCVVNRPTPSCPPPRPAPPQLSKNYARALARVSKELEFFPKYLQHRNKQRLTKIHQYLIRMRKLKLKTNKCVWVLVMW